MKHLPQSLFIALATIGLATTSAAVVLVNDTWRDGGRTNPPPPTYSENGTDTDSDTDLESAWFRGGVGSMTVVNATPGTTPGILQLATATAASSSWTTYFTPDGSPVTLVNAGDQIKVTWVFTPTTVNGVSTAQGFRIAIVDTPNAGRVAADASPGTSTYAGYAIFGNMGTTLGNANPFQLRERTDPATASALLSAAGSWTSLFDGESSGVTGYADGTQYTFVFTATRTAGLDTIGGNSDDELDIVVTMTGGSLGGDGTLEAAYTDLTPNSFTFDTFSLRPSTLEDSAALLDTSLFKVEGPSAVPTPPSIASEPQDLTRTVGQLAVFSVGANGTAPLHYQWYFNTNTPLPNATNATLQLANVQTSQAGMYSVTITNSQGTTNSRYATLTVNLPIHTDLGVISDDRWDDSDRISGPVGISNSVWYASVANSLTAGLNSMLTTASPTGSRLWLGYFTDDVLTPVDLAVGRAIRATLVFTPSNVATQNTSSLRFGLFNYADGATRVAADGSSSGNAVNVTGYMLTQNFGESFGDDSPMNLYARNNLASQDLLTTTGDYASLGSGPDGSTNAPGFASGTEYTLAFTVVRADAASTRVFTRITGGSLDISHVVTDDLYAYRRFDAFGIRANRNFDSADQLNITRFLVEVIEAPNVPFQITSIARLSADAVKVSWDSISNKVYQVQSRSLVNTGSWTTNATITATGGSTSYTNSGLGAIPQRFYQVVNLP